MRTQSRDYHSMQVLPNTRMFPQSVSQDPRIFLRHNNEMDDVDIEEVVVVVADEVERISD
jgi:hypothetical protein